MSLASASVFYPAGNGMPWHHKTAEKLCVHFHLNLPMIYRLPAPRTPSKVHAVSLSAMSRYNLFVCDRLRIAFTQDKLCTHQRHSVFARLRNTASLRPAAPKEVCIID